MRARTAIPLLLLLVAAVSACSSSGAGSATSSESGRVTASTSPSGGTTSSAGADGSDRTAVSTVKGRSHDVGTIVSSKTVGGLRVLVLDRWTQKGMTDAQLAARGATLSPHKAARFYDQNSSKTYTVPVTPSAPIVVNTCVQTKGSPATMSSSPTSLTDWLASPGRSKVIVLLTYDAAGQLTRLDTDPIC